MFGLRARFPGGLALATLLALAAGEVTAEDGPKKNTADSKLTAGQLAQQIDRGIDARLAKEKVDPSPRGSDEEFLRRAYLDITGKVPTAEKAAAFLDSKDANKRGKLIDELLASKDYGRHFA